MTLKYLKKHYNIVIFLNILLIIGIILGLILGFKQDSIFKTDIINSLTDLQNLLLTNRINNIFYHFLIFIILVISSFIMPLFFINFIIILFKGLTIGFSIYIFALLLGFKGFIISLIYNLVTSGMFCFIYIFLIIRGINLSKNIINFTLTKDNTYLLAIKNNLFGITLTEGICLIYDCFLFIFSNFLISKFIWLF